ncbi:MAG: efflux RND transporter periplasmic adaptor subunit [Betaproteobacteria bacterium]|nr:efflux RND transporter periplasmic adaptor subunit [Betaproteobacteria bacterium]
MTIRSVLLCVALGFAPAHAAQPLATAAVEYREVDEVYTVDGTVEAVKQSTVAAQISGRVVEIRFDAGDRVKQGETIVRIDAREVSDALASAEAQRAQAQATLINAKATYERTRELFGQKFVSQAALDKALADYRAAQGQFEAAAAGASRAATIKGYAVVAAPYSGVVAARHVELGETVNPGTPLMTGFAPQDLRVVADIPQFKLGAIRRDAPARVEFVQMKQWVEASPSVLPTADARTHTTRVRLALPRYVEGTYPGMYARVHFTVGRTKKLRIPAVAVVRRTEVTGVYVVGENDALQFRQVRLGAAAGDAGVEVLAGLKPGERVALDPVAAAIRLRGQPAKP